MTSEYQWLRSAHNAGASAAAALSETKARVCPICGPLGRPRVVSEANVDTRRLDAYAFSSRKTPELMHHRLVRCGTCDLVYADPAPNPESLREAYLEAAFDSSAEARCAAATYGRVLDRIIARLPGRDGALDIGTGEGAFLRELVRRGFTEVGGIEPSAAAITQSSPDVWPLVEQGVFSAAARPEGSLNLVTCFQTIEHLHDPLRTCESAVRMLRPGGALLIVAHNSRAFSARVLGRRSPIYDIEHLQLFSHASLRALLLRAGLHDVTTWPLVNRYPLPYWIRLLPLPNQAKRVVVTALELHANEHAAASAAGRQHGRRWLPQVSPAAPAVPGWTSKARPFATRLRRLRGITDEPVEMYAVDHGPRHARCGARAADRDGSHR